MHHCLMLIIISLQCRNFLAMHFHHSDYKVHHKMGKMKIKVKPEGAKLIFTGGDLDVDLHPAHGYVRPIHNVIVSHEHPDENHHEVVQHHEIEHEEGEEENSGHHGWHHSYHHDEHGGHDDEGYGFRHFHHWPNSLDGEHSFLGHDFYHDNHGHGGDHHGHFRDEINDAKEADHHYEDEGGHSRHKITGEWNDDIGRASNDDVTGQSRDRTFYRTIDNSRNDAVIYGKKIYPNDMAAPTHRSQMEENFEKVSSRIVPEPRKQQEETEEGSARGTISPFDDENDAGKEKRVKGDEGREHNYGGGDEYQTETNGDYERIKKFSKKHPNVDIKELERIASRIKTDIPEEDEIPIQESTRNTKDIGSPSNVYVNMSGEPHQYGDENKEDYPNPARSFRPDLADNENEKSPGDYYPMEEENWARPRDDNENESEGYKKSLSEFDTKSHKLLATSNEAGRKKNLSPPVVVHPDGNPLSGDIKKAFYEFHPTRHLTQHLATINDINVRSRIHKSHLNQLLSKQKINRSRRHLLANRLINRQRY